MKLDEIFNATLNKDHTIEVHINKNYTGQFAQHFYLYCDDIRIAELQIIEKRESGHHFHYKLNNVPALTIGAEYKIYDDRYIYCYLNMNVLLKNEKICSLFYSNEVMGAHYHKYYTTFRIFSPLAKCAYVVLNKDGIESMVHLEKDTDTGVFYGRVQGDYEKARYYYVVRINGQLISVNDPYVTALTSQSSRGVIVNPESVHVDLNDKYLKPMGGITDAVIYELSVRDMTSMKQTSITQKGKFLGLTESSCKSKNSNPIGLDYIKSLGISHVQILPMYDFCTVSDENPSESYNWGYDPLYYNTPEGSYSTNPSDPYARIIEMKKMIAAFHKSNIRVVMDVVYNHVFCMEFSPFEKICPSYYFRFKEDGTPSNGSFCGNEFNSNHKMAQKFIVDSCVYWVKEYGIDGLRFDLMGLIDIDTINLVYEKCREIRPDFIIYGEGWDMPTTLPGDKMAKMYNQNKLPTIGFFNDRFRDVVKGKSSEHELYVRGYLSGDTNYIDGFKHCFLGSCLPIAFPPLFTHVSQSINYVECHDNATLYDKLKVCCYDDNEEQIKKRVNLVNAINILSFGVPFIHAGQEFGSTKKGVNNSYNSGDEVNHIDYDLMDKNISMVNYFKDIVSIRNYFKFFRTNDLNAIAQNVEMVNLPQGCLMIKFKQPLVETFKEFALFINPTHSNVEFSTESIYTIIANETGILKNPVETNSMILNEISLNIGYIKD